MGILKIIEYVAKSRVRDARLAVVIYDAATNDATWHAAAYDAAVANDAARYAVAHDDAAASDDGLAADDDAAGYAAANDDATAGLHDGPATTNDAVAGHRSREDHGSRA